MRDFLKLGFNRDSSANLALVAASVILLTSGVFKAASADALPNEWGVSHTPQTADVSVLQNADAAAIARATGEASASSVADFMRATGVPAAPSLSSLDPHFHEKTRSPITASTLPQTGRTPLSGTAARLPSLAPDIATAIINGKHPPQLTAKRLMRLTLIW